VSNVFLGCCNGGNESELPGIISARSSIRGATKGQPRYYGARDREAFTEVESWLGGVPSSLGSSWSRPGTHSTWNRSGTSRSSFGFVHY
jgi:hypothetical protein